MQSPVLGHLDFEDAAAKVTHLAMSCNAGELLDNQMTGCVAHTYMAVPYIDLDGACNHRSASPFTKTRVSISYQVRSTRDPRIDRVILYLSIGYYVAKNLC